MYVNKDMLKMPVNIELADSCFNTPKTIDMILGAEIFFPLLNNVNNINQLKPIPNGPTWQSTRF